MRFLKFKKGTSIRNKFYMVYTKDNDKYTYDYSFVTENGKKVFMNIREQKRILYNGEPCIYTDTRFDTEYIFNGGLFHRFKTDMSYKEVMEELSKKYYNIPSDMDIQLKSIYQYVKSGKPLHYTFPIGERLAKNVVKYKYKIDNPLYYNNFKNDSASNLLVNQLRDIGFNVMVGEFESTIEKVAEDVTTYNGRIITKKDIGQSYEHHSIKVEYAIAYGFGIKLGFAENNHGIFDYNSTKNNIAYDFYDCFCKWSKCELISRDKSFEEILNILRETMDIHIKEEDEEGFNWTFNKL